jgi:redox-sensitive bicupin YhaK (pirin superfamily)
MVTVWAGAFFHYHGLPPPKDSYAADPSSEIGIWFIEISPGGKIKLPKAVGGNSINRRAYFLEGDSIMIGKTSIPVKSEVTLDASEATIISNPKQSTATAEILVLQGKPIDEQRVLSGPFLMSSVEELDEAYRDYQQTKFGGWLWPKEAMVFPREKGRFVSVQGKETIPPND